MSEPNRCQECGAEMPSGTLEGLCPKCLLAAGFESRDDQDQSAGTAPTTPHSGSFVPPDPAWLAAHFPQLETLQLVGCGGMGAVYKARQSKLDRLVALKIIRPESADTPAFAERFNREAATADWPMRLTWQSLTPHPAGPDDTARQALDDRAYLTLRGLLRRFVTAERLDAAAPPTTRDV